MADTPEPATDQWRSFTHEELEREYSPSSCVPNGDISSYLQEYADRSAAAREQLGEHGATFTEVRYGSEPTQTIDLALPAASMASTPLLVFIHGGYWQQLSKRESFFAATAALEHGIAFAAIDYTLAPL